MQFLEDSKKIHFDPIEHIYSLDKKRCISVTNFISQFKNKFDADGEILKRKAAEANVTPDEMRQEWDKKRDDASEYGSHFHASIERYINTKKIKRDKHYKTIKHFADTYKFKGEIFSEVVIFDDDLLIAGTSDIVQIIDNKIVQCHDFKTNSKPLSDFSYGKKMLEPIAHLNDSKLNIYFLQISLYLYLLSSKYNYEIGDNNFIFWLNRKKNILEKIPVQLRINEIIDMIAYYTYHKSLDLSAESV